MGVRLQYVLLLLIGIFVLHFAAVYSGLYDLQIRMGFVWWDNVLHAGVGITFGLLWLWFLEKMEWKSSPRFAGLSTFGFVFLLAAGWELAEYALLTFAPDIAHSLKLYSVSLNEATADTLSNLFGALLLLWLLQRKSHSLDKPEAGR